MAQSLHNDTMVYCLRSNINIFIHAAPNSYFVKILNIPPPPDQIYNFLSLENNFPDKLCIVISDVLK